MNDSLAATALLLVLIALLAGGVLIKLRTGRTPIRTLDTIQAP
jgi:hypothetical protein